MIAIIVGGNIIGPKFQRLDPWVTIYIVCVGVMAMAVLIMDWQDYRKKK